MIIFQVASCKSLESKMEKVLDNILVSKRISGWLSLARERRYGKSGAVSDKIREQGNIKFGAGDNGAALKLYTESVICAPSGKIQAEAEHQSSSDFLIQVLVWVWPWVTGPPPSTTWVSTPRPWATSSWRWRTNFPGCWSTSCTCAPPSARSGWLSTRSAWRDWRAAGRRWTGLSSSRTGRPPSSRTSAPSTTRLRGCTAVTTHRMSEGAVIATVMSLENTVIFRELVINSNSRLQMIKYVVDISGRQRL